MLVPKYFLKILNNLDYFYVYQLCQKIYYFFNDFNEFNFS